LNKDSLSYIRGFNFYFEDDGHIIHVWSSAITGLEKVYVDNALVSTSRNVSTLSEHEIKIGSIDYKVVFSAESIIKGPFHCTLYKNNTLLKNKKIMFGNQERPLVRLARRLFIFLLLVMLGVVCSYFDIPAWCFVILSICVLMIIDQYTGFVGFTPKVYDED
jgi:hypothetical protein